MKSLLGLVNLKPSEQPTLQPALFLYDYDHPLRRSYGLHDDTDYFPYGKRTTLCIVFDGETQRRFSSVKIMLYCDMSLTESSRLSHTCVGVSVLEILMYCYTAICTGHSTAGAFAIL